MAIVLPSHNIDSMSHPPKPTSNDAAERKFYTQTAKLVHETLYALLADEGVRLNGQRHGEELRFNDRETADVHNALHGACKHLKEMFGQEIRAQIDTVDISPSALCTSYHQLMGGLFKDDCNWGTVVMLFSASALLAARVYRNGQTTSVESIEKWQISFILQNLKHWIVQHRGWVSHT